MSQKCIRKRRKNPCPWWRGCAWSAGDLTGPLTMRETCVRCGASRTFNGALDEYTYYAPKDAP